MPLFHTAAKATGDIFIAVRLLYGIHPMLPRLDNDPTYLGRALSTRHVMKFLNLSEDDLNQCLGIVTGRWLRAKEQIA
jgi:hypothetical protein